MLVYKVAIALPPMYALTTAGSKNDVVRLWQDNETCGFLMPRYPIAQNATDYLKWSTATELYPIVPEECYEPWFIAERTTYPLFDVRYRGYGYNKQSQVQCCCSHAGGYTDRCP